MFEVPDNQWFRDHLCDEATYRWYPEKIGAKRSIFRRPDGMTLLSMGIDPMLTAPTWKYVYEGEPTKSLFSLLAPFTANDAGIAFFTFPDGALIELMFNRALEENEFKPWMLKVFEAIPADQGGPQVLVIFLRNKEGVIIFSRFDCFEISYYGSDSLWKEISSALWD
jgi:hypothetical protein